MPAGARNLPILLGTHVSEDMAHRLDKVIAAKMAEGESYKACTRSEIMRQALEMHLKKLEMMYL